LQSPRAQKILSGHNLSLNDYSSFVLFAGNKIYTRSTAALMVAKKIKQALQNFYIPSSYYPNLYGIQYIISLQKTVINGLAKSKPAGFPHQN
jgi:hypothetical protein